MLKSESKLPSGYLGSYHQQPYLALKSFLLLMDRLDAQDCLYPSKKKIQYTGTMYIF